MPMTEGERIAVINLVVGGYLTVGGVVTLGSGAYRVAIVRRESDDLRIVCTGMTPSQQATGPGLTV